MKYGIVLIRDAPIASGCVEKLAGVLGHIHNSHEG